MKKIRCYFGFHNKVVFHQNYLFHFQDAPEDRNSLTFTPTYEPTGLLVKAQKPLKSNQQKSHF